MKVKILATLALLSFTIFFIFQNSEKKTPQNENIKIEHTSSKKFSNDDLNQTKKDVRDALVSKSNSVLAESKSSLPQYSTLVQKYLPIKNLNCDFEEADLEELYSSKVLNSSLIYLNLSECANIIIESLIKKSDFTNLSKMVLALDLNPKTNNPENESTFYDDYYLTRIYTTFYAAIDAVINNTSDTNEKKRISEKKALLHEKILSLDNKLKELNSSTYTFPDFSLECYKAWAVAPALSLIPQLSSFTKNQLESILNEMYLRVHGQGASSTVAILPVAYCLSAHADTQEPFNTVKLDPEKTSLLTTIINWNMNSRGTLAKCDNSEIGFAKEFDASYENYTLDKKACEKYRPNFITNLKVSRLLKKVELFL